MRRCTRAPVAETHHTGARSGGISLRHASQHNQAEIAVGSDWNFAVNHREAMAAELPLPLATEHVVRTEQQADVSPRHAAHMCDNIERRMNEFDCRSV